MKLNSCSVIGNTPTKVEVTVQIRHGKLTNVAFLQNCQAGQERLTKENMPKKFEQILRNPPMKSLGNPKLGCSSEIDYPTWLSQLREAIRQVTPKVEKSHTCSSENAEVYRAYDNGQKDMLAKINQALDNETGVGK